MAAEFYARLSGVWRKAAQLYLRSGGVWREAKQVYYRSGGVWRLVFEATPTLTSATATPVRGLEVDDVEVNWTISGGATGWTLTIETAWVGIGVYTTRYTGSNGGAPIQIVPYWGGALVNPANPGESLFTDALVRVSLKNGSGVHAPGSPRTIGPGL